MTTSLQERITLTTIIVASFFSLAAALTLAGLFGVFDQTQFDRAFEVFSECSILASAAIFYWFGKRDGA